jgi:ferrous iron transport protein B
LGGEHAVTAAAVAGGSPVDAAKTSPRASIVIIGNPNTGKTTLFNALTGETARVGNYPGITVDRRVGALRLTQDGGTPIELDAVDLPGTYSLSARSPEEKIAFDAVLGLSGQAIPKLAVVVIDAGQLSRNLYLAVQLMELDVPVVVALNMIDEVAENPPDATRLTEALGVPCVPTSARNGTGLDALKAEIARALKKPPRKRPIIAYPSTLLDDAAALAHSLPENLQTGIAPRQALALWALSSVDDDELADIPQQLRDHCRRIRASNRERDVDLEIIAPRYAFIDSLMPYVVRGDPHPPKRKASERIDRVMLHPVAGFVIFVAVMLMLFQALFSWTEPLISLVEGAVGALQSLLVARVPEGLLRDLLVEGVVGGVGNVLVFLPQIMLLFAFIGLMEDSGYMSRVAFLIDRVMRGLGLHGRAFVPMLSGFACAVPAILATRTLERQRDRLLTMLVVPLTTCSARLPVYTLIIGALFPAHQLWGFIPVQGALMVGMYAFAMVLTLLAALVLGRTVVRGHQVPLILELPPYRVPNLVTTAKMVRERSWDFVREAGTIILVCTVALWALLTFPRTEATMVPPDRPVAAATVAGSEASASGVQNPTASIESSYGARLGKVLEPVIAPLGFDWRIGVGLVGAFAAREVFVSTMALVYGIGNDAEDDAVPLRERMRNERTETGARRYSPLVGASLLAFFAIACQCSSTLAVVRRETKSLRWPAFLFGYTAVLAWLVSCLVYQGGRALGLG